MKPPTKGRKPISRSGVGRRVNVYMLPETIKQLEKLRRRLGESATVAGTIRRLIQHADCP